jgi:hypothetical protein
MAKRGVQDSATKENQHLVSHIHVAQIQFPENITGLARYKPLHVLQEADIRAGNLL